MTEPQSGTEVARARDHGFAPVANRLHRLSGPSMDPAGTRSPHRIRSGE